MKTLLPVLLLTTLAGCAHVTPSGGSSGSAQRAVAATSQSQGAFSRLDVRGPVDVTVHEGRPFAMSVAVEGIPASAVETRVEGGTLVVDLNEDERHHCFGICAHRVSAKLDLDVPTLDAVVIDGSGDVNVEGAGSHPRFDIDVNGSGDIAYSGEAELLHCHVQGSGDVKLEGEAKRLEVSVAGSGDVDAHALAAGGGQFDIDGSGNLTVDLHGGDTAIHVHGSGDMVYSGQARITALDVSGSGDVRTR